MNYLKGQVQISAVTGVVIMFGAIGAPFLYVGGINATNATQDVKIATVQTDISEIKNNVEYIRRTLEAMSVKQGIQGVQGIQGTTGAQGVQGVRGAPGVQGTPGVDTN